MNFHKDELIWRNDARQHDEMMTRLTNIKRDKEFERQIFLMRVARAFGGIGDGWLRHWQSRYLAEMGQKVLVFLLLATVGVIDNLIALTYKCLKIRKKGIFEREGSDSSNNQLTVPNGKH